MDFVIVFFGEYLGYVLIAILLVLWRRNFKKYLPVFWHMAAAALLSRGIITEVIRFFWQRSRPFAEQNIAPLVEHAASPSFPSGHAAFYFAIGTVLYFHNKKVGTAFLLGSLVMGIARVVAGLHWPSDIIGGAVVGILSGIVIQQISQRIWKRTSSS